jgi:PAS domain S-box-containing protein
VPVLDARFFRNVVEHMPRVSVCVFDLDLTYYYASGDLLRDFGVTPEAVIGRRIGMSSVSTEVGERVAAQARRAICGAILEEEFQHGERYYETHATPFREDGDIVGGMLVTRDITHRVRGEQQKEMLARTDRLTGCLNKYYFDALVRRHVMRNPAAAARSHSWTWTGSNV